MRKLTILTYMILSIIIVPTSIYALQNINGATEKSPEEIALNWLINAPTFKFDGIPSSVKVINSWMAMTFAPPGFWGVEIEFECQHTGYGDRTGQILAQVITRHRAIIHVTEGVVTLAQIDNQWDELNQNQDNPSYTVDVAEMSALTWLYNCPTFKFDGVPETVSIKNIVPLRARMPNAWDVYIDFTCNYPGYGDRTGNVMLGHSQVHIIRITVIENQVTGAIIDNIWDEVNQVMIN